MFKFFKRKIKDEPLVDQLKEVQEQNRIMKKTSEISFEIKDGCDEIPEATGEFGLDPNNPIPINGVKGEIKYLNRLRCECGTNLIFHRLGSKNGLDIYETACSNNKHWNTFYLDMYYARRSKKIPNGYTFAKFHPVFSKLAIGYGTNSRCKNFPYDLPELIEKQIRGKLGNAFARNVQVIIEKNFKNKSASDSN